MQFCAVTRHWSNIEQENKFHTLIHQNYPFDAENIIDCCMECDFWFILYDKGNNIVGECSIHIKRNFLS